FVLFFFFKVDREQSKGGDETGLNGILLSCVNTTTFEVVKQITSSVGPWGTWTPIQWCPGGFLSTFCLCVEPKQGNEDDTAADNIIFGCTVPHIVMGNGLERGLYGAWSDTCTEGINGINIRLEKPKGIGDDTSVNDVLFNCA
uniref:Vitelline membrane outer layer 1-like protein n=1 Tax=Leptobrachium leishanense TaxID=445787 RepID=A0A8C5M5G6_9ANUR